MGMDIFTLIYGACLMAQPNQDIKLIECMNKYTTCTSFAAKQLPPDTRLKICIDVYGSELVWRREE